MSTDKHRFRLTFDVSRYWDSALIFLAALFLYTLTLSPDVLPADSGEFQVVVPLLGVAHPPGFALYTLLGKLFISIVPQGAPAYRLNLFSAFTSALTLVIVNRTVYRLTRHATRNTFHVSRLSILVSRLPGLAAALALGLSTTFWSQATTANIRSLMALLTATLVYALVEFRLTPTANRLAIFAFFLSLAVVHHLSIAFIGLILALATLWFSPPLLKARPERSGAQSKGLQERGPGGEARAWLKILLAALVPLAVLLYLPVRGAANAYLAPTGLNTPSGFLQHVLATGFGGDFFYFANLSALPDRLAILLNIFLFQFNPALLILLALGLILFFRQDWKLATSLTLAFTAHSFVAITYRAPQTVEYLLPAYVILVIAAPAGLHSALYLPHASRRFTFGVLRFTFWASFFIASSFVAIRNFPAYFTLSLDHSTRAYAESALEAAPPNAVILSSWHQATPMWYLQQIEGLRPDVAVEYVFPQGTSLAQNWVDRITATASNNQLLITNLYPAEYADLPYRLTPAGPIWQIVTQPVVVSPATIVEEHEGGWAVASSGYPKPAVIAPGGALPVTVTWRAPANPTDINFFVQLIGSDGLLYGQMDVTHHASRITPNELLTDRYDITVNVDAQPGAYRLVAGAYLPNGARLAPDFTELGTVTVLPRSEPPATAHPRAFGLLAGYDYDLTLAYAPRLYLHWRLDEQPHTLTLKDSAGSSLQTINLPPSPGYLTTALDLPGDYTVRVTLFDSNSSLFTFPPPDIADRYVSFGPIVLTRAEVTREDDGSYRVDLDWLADRPLTEDLIVKVDLVGENYSWRAQSDSVPAGGAIPTLKWIPGITIRDRHRLTPQAQTPAAFQLAVYDHFTQRTLPILDSRLAALGPTVPLGTVQP
jgi:hypothetical protein